MKKYLILCLIASSFTQSLLGQNTQSIGLTLNLTPDFSPYGYNSYSINTYAHTRPQLGVRYTHNIGKLTFRTGVTASRQNLNYNEESGTYFWGLTGNRVKLQSYAGIVKYFGNRKVQPYLGSDLFYHYDQFVGYVYDNGCFGSSSGNLNSKKHAIGLAILGGLKVKLTTNLALHTEISESISHVFNAQSYDGEMSKNSFNSHRFNPLYSFGISYLF